MPPLGGFKKVLFDPSAEVFGEGKVLRSGEGKHDSGHPQGDSQGRGFDVPHHDVN